MSTTSDSSLVWISLTTASTDVIHAQISRLGAPLSAEILMDVDRAEQLLAETSNSAVLVIQEPVNAIATLLARGYSADDAKDIWREQIRSAIDFKSNHAGRALLISDTGIFNDPERGRSLVESLRRGGELPSDSLFRSKELTVKNPLEMLALTILRDDTVLPLHSQLEAFTEAIFPVSAYSDSAVPDLQPPGTQSTDEETATQRAREVDALLEENTALLGELHRVESHLRDTLSHKASREDALQQAKRDLAEFRQTTRQSRNERDAAFTALEKRYRNELSKVDRLRDKVAQLRSVLSEANERESAKDDAIEALKLSLELARQRATEGTNGVEFLRGWWQQVRGRRR